MMRHHPKQNGSGIGARHHSNVELVSSVATASQHGHAGGAASLNEIPLASSNSTHLTVPSPFNSVQIQSNNAGIQIKDSEIV